MEKTPENPSRLLLHFPSTLNLQDPEDPSSSSRHHTEREAFFEKTLEILTKAGEQRNPRDLRLLMNFTESFQYFQRLKEKPSTSVLHARFCRVMKLRILRKGDTLFYAGLKKFCFFRVFFLEKKFEFFFSKIFGFFRENFRVFFLEKILFFSKIFEFFFSKIFGFFSKIFEFFPRKFSVFFMIFFEKSMFRRCS